jgi:hypothetical protein
MTAVMVRVTAGSDTAAAVTDTTNSRTLMTGQQLVSLAGAHNLGQGIRCSALEAPGIGSSW